MLDSNIVILDSDTFLSSLRFTQKHSHSTLTLTQTNSICLKLIHSHLTWWWLPSWILPSWIWPSWIQPFCTKKLHSFFLTQFDDSSHLEFCQFEFHHLGFNHFSFSSQTHSHLPRLGPTICTKITSLIHSDSTWWWQPSSTLPCWIQTLPSWTQTPCYLLSDSLKNTLSTLTLTQTNSIWFKLILSHLTKWWQPSSILTFWIWPYLIHPS